MRGTLSIGPPQRGCAGAVRDRADIRELQRRLRPPAAADADAGKRGAALRAGLPAAREALRRRQRLRQAQQLVDGDRHRHQPAGPGGHAGGQHPLPVLLRGGDPGGQQAPGAAAGLGRQHRPGPPAGGQRGAAGDHLDLPRRRAGESVRGDRDRRRRPQHARLVPRPRATVLPPLPMHGGDRNRTSPFAFTGNKFEFRALGSSMSLALPNTVLNTIVAEAIDDLSDALEAAVKGGKSVDEALPAILQKSFSENSRIVFEGDNYSDEWHAEAEKRGLLNLRTTPDALPQLLEQSTVDVFGKYEVLSKREIESRYEVAAEQYSTNLNIEAETLADMARTMVLPAALRQLALAEQAGVSK